MNIKEIRKLLKKRKKELMEFDKLPKEEKLRLTREGYNPHESKATRKRKRAAALEQRKKKFDNLSLEQRKALESFGWSPYQDRVIIRRVCGSFKAV